MMQSPTTTINSTSMITAASEPTLDHSLCVKTGREEGFLFCLFCAAATATSNIALYVVSFHSKLQLPSIIIVNFIFFFLIDIIITPTTATRSSSHSH